MKKINKYLSFFVLAATVVSLPACSDDDKPGTSLQSPAEASVAKEITPVSVSFDWEEVSGARQYGIVIYDADDSPVVSDVTKDTKAYFDGLNPSTDYVAKISAYGAYDGVLENNPETTIKFRTLDPYKLDTPTNLKGTSSSAGLKVSWNKVDNAESYSYSYNIKGSDEIVTGTVKAATVTLRGLQKATYEFRVKAETSNVSYVSSDLASGEFAYSPKAVWKVTGTMYSCYWDTSWSTTLEYYGDNTYTLSKWYNADGYDLEFTVNTDGTITINNGVNSSDGWVVVPAMVGYDCSLWAEDCRFEGDFDGGSIKLWESWGNNYSTFTW